MPPSHRHAALFVIPPLMCVALFMGERSWGQARTPRSQVDTQIPVQLLPKHAHTDSIAGSERSPDVQLRFENIDSLPIQIDRFDVLHARMDELRRTFSHHVATALHILPFGDRYCPDGVAVPYYKAWLAGRSYETLGAELEALHQAIQRLNGPGESIEMSPDQRQTLEQMRMAYRSTLVDYGEMRAAMAQHLEPEMRFRRCRPDALLRQGARQVPAGLSASAPPAHMAATFFIDNRACGDSFDLIVDGALLGKVDAHQNVALQTTAGRHRLCLIEQSSDLDCGAPGTVRMAHIYDGWSITTHCR